jgi:peptidoglycan/xylan/chitin deacetylase (PgdA/CDA1 family)|tara:strand:- start:11385 stop:12416 length:1032 start_codon:yes stop_codon:yes gene_type:complete
MTKKFIFIYFLFIIFNLNLYAENSRYFEFDKGIITLMYHRFDEHKYPSTNIQMTEFKKQIELIEKLNIKYFDPKNFDKKFNQVNTEKSIMITIDDGFQSFYQNAWPLLKSKKIPFLLFISTSDVGKNGYINWDQILEIEKSGLGTIGNHSHSHEYLADFTNENIILDIKKSINIFQNKLGYNPIFFSYPFGEYSNNLKKITSDLGFKFAFGQHSGVVDLTKDPLELPRFPINEKYGDLERFKFLINLLPFQFKEILPQEKLIINEQNPPDVVISFFDNQKNLNNINCYSNENDKWRKSNLLFLSETKIRIVIKEKFTTERGRINCSLNDSLGWRWFGIQFVIL